MSVNKVERGSREVLDWKLVYLLKPTTGGEKFVPMKAKAQEDRPSNWSGMDHETVRERGREGDPGSAEMSAQVEHRDCCEAKPATSTL